MTPSTPSIPPGTGADAGLPACVGLPVEARLERLRAGEPGVGPADFRGARLIGLDLSGLNLARADFAGADLSRANLEGANLFGASLAGATLFEARLERAELTAADLSGANLEGADLTQAGLGRATLTGAKLARAALHGATLSEASLVGADLHLVHGEGARLRSADLAAADLTQADLRGADLHQARVVRAVFDRADLRGATLSGLRGPERAHWLGVDLREIDFTGAHLVRSVILDQNYLEEFRTRSRFNGYVFLLWRLTSDCGRSATRWSICTALIALLFAWIYTLVGINYGAHVTPLSPLYFSVVTLTTLGYGDVLPTTIAGQIVVMTEVMTGYVLLGGLLSIFSNKMASRATSA